MIGDYWKGVLPKSFTDFFWSESFLFVPGPANPICGPLSSVLDATFSFSRNEFLFYLFFDPAISLRPSRAFPRSAHFSTHVDDMKNFCPKIPPYESYESRFWFPKEWIMYFEGNDSAGNSQPSPRLLFRFILNENINETDQISKDKKKHHSFWNDVNILIQVIFR